MAGWGAAVCAVGVACSLGTEPLSEHRKQLGLGVMEHMARIWLMPGNEAGLGRGGGVGEWCILSSLGRP